jgi:hypothetical protein
MTAAPRRTRSSVFEIDTFDFAAALLLAVLFALVLATFKEYAVSNDEGLQHHYGELIIAYYKSGFADKSVFDFQNLYLYGGLFDIIAVLPVVLPDRRTRSLVYRDAAFPLRGAAARCPRGNRHPRGPLIR